MESYSEILKNAAHRAAELGLPYSGALTPVEAFELMQEAGARLIDVRTRAEWDYVGRVPGSVLIEWQTYPDSRPNPDFLKQLQAEVDADTPVMFLCRSGARSNAAAALAAKSGYSRSFNVLEGFEGDKDAQGHRSTVGGWRLAGLPWVQG
jgi:rhodanese-related sulfurtransferase